MNLKQARAGCFLKAVIVENDVAHGDKFIKRYGELLHDFAKESTSINMTCGKFLTAHDARQG